MKWGNNVFTNAGKSADGIRVVIGANVKKIPAFLSYSSDSSSAPEIVSVEFAEGSVCESIGYDAFRGCTSLTSITIPDSVTSIGSYAFSGCTSLTSINIPDSVTIIGDRAFEGCSSLANVKIGNGITSINYYAFYGCTSLASVTIPESVTFISWYAFDNCTSLTDVYYTGTSDQWSQITVGSNNKPLKNATIHYNHGK